MSIISLNSGAFYIRTQCRPLQALQLLFGGCRVLCLTVGLILTWCQSLRSSLFHRWPSRRHNSHFPTGLGFLVCTCDRRCASPPRSLTHICHFTSHYLHHASPAHFWNEWPKYMGPMLHRLALCSHIHIRKYTFDLLTCKITCIWHFNLSCLHYKCDHEWVFAIHSVHHDVSLLATRCVFGLFIINVEDAAILA